MWNRKTIDEAKALLVAPVLIGLAVASTTAVAKPNSNDNSVPNPNENSVQEVEVYAVDWGEPKCSSFSLEPLGGARIKEISNIVLSCDVNDAGDPTWSKWEFSEGSPYVFGTVLPTDLEPTEGNGCTGLISVAYVKAGSQKSGKGLAGTQFNGQLGGAVLCEDTSSSPPPTGGN